MKFTLSVFLVLIAYLLISIRFPYVSSQEMGTKCADCRQYDAEDSTHTTYGFYCKSKEDHKKFVSKGQNLYPVCIPEGLGFHSSYLLNPEIFDYCCFWGPDLPCGQLVGKKQQEKWVDTFPITCQMCKEHCFPHPQVQDCADCGEFNKKHYKHKKNSPKYSKSSDANGFELSSILLFLSIVQCVLIWKI